MNNISSGNARHPELMPINNFEIPAVEFKNLELNNMYTPALVDFPSGNLLDVPASSILAQGINPSYHNKSYLPSIHPSKRLRSSESFFPGLNSSICNAFASGNHYNSDNPMQIGKSFTFSAYDHNNPAIDHARTSSLPDGSHAVLNGNSSSSEPCWAMKLELPSLQTQMVNWGSPSPSSPLPSFESVDILIQTPPNEQHVHSSNLLPQNSGLLDAVLHESETMRNSKSNGVEQTPHASSMTVDDSAHALHESEWGAYEEQLSPLGHSSSSVFRESTPISGNSLDEPFPTGTLRSCLCLLYH